jgi:hypothetical protein
VATADSIWTLEGARSSPSASTTPPPVTPSATGPPQAATQPPDTGRWRSWLAIGALGVLAGALAVRFAAGRRLRRRPPGRS